MSAASNYDDVISQLQSIGLVIDYLEVGRVRRVKVEGSREKKGWYSLFEITRDDGDTMLVGTYGVWQGNDPGTQKISFDKNPLTDEQKEAIRARYAEDKKRAQANRQREIRIAAGRAHKVWLKALPVGESEYLTSKGVQAHGLRFTETGSIVVPMMDNSSNVFGLQFILPKGHPRKKKTGRNKEFWPAGMEMRGKYHLIGGVPDRVLLVAEGYATAATLHEQSGLPVAVGFNANNLLPVAQNLKKRYKRTHIVICGDDDYLTEGNPGKQSAEAAALAVSGSYIIPDFNVDREGKKLTDFNDLQMLEGGQEVQKQVERHLLDMKLLQTREAGAASVTQGGGEGRLKSLLTIDEAIDRYSLIYGASGTMFDHQESALVPKSDVLDICPDHAWREMKISPDRSVVRLSEVGFDPTETDDRIICNLWGGWPSKPKAGQCDLLLGLLQKLCEGEEAKNSDALYQWVLKWLAFPLQHPGAKMKTSLIFHGLQGVGKNLFFEAYGAIFEQFHIVVGQAELDDKFNDWASAKLFIIADEVVARQELFHIKNKIKALITSDTIRINPKNVSAHVERNHANIVFFSNETQPLVIEPGDRRFAVIWCPTVMSDVVYADIAEERDNGGIAALHDFLLNLDLADFHENSKPPMTQAKQDLIDINLGSVERFARDWLECDLDLPVTICMSTDLYKAYQDYCKKKGVLRPREMNQFVGTVGKLPGWSKERKRIYKAVHSNTEMQATLIFPLAKIDGRDDCGSDTAWYTKCVFDFKEALQNA